jgi:hypothetical protein
VPLADATTPEPPGRRIESDEQTLRGSDPCTIARQAEKLRDQESQSVDADKKQIMTKRIFAESCEKFAKGWDCLDMIKVNEMRVFVNGIFSTGIG